MNTDKREEVKSCVHGAFSSLFLSVIIRVIRGYSLLYLPSVDSMSSVAIHSFNSIKYLLSQFLPVKDYTS